MTCRARTEPHSRGQAAPMVMVLFAMTAATLLVAIEVGHLLEESARASTAADAAALAGAAEGHSGAASMAAANGGSLLSYHEERLGEGVDAVVVTVSVEVGRATRTARAQGVTEWTTAE